MANRMLGGTLPGCERVYKLSWKEGLFDFKKYFFSFVEASAERRFLVSEGRIIGNDSDSAIETLTYDEYSKEVLNV